MAKHEQLEILTQGVKVWNKWRRKHANILPDLSCTYLGFADLEGADLSRANLSQATLNDANLSGANLNDANLNGAALYDAFFTRANLGGARLRNAVLSDSNLSHADLSHADLSFSILIEADLSEAVLKNANLTRAHLSEADLSGAILSGANLYDTNLSRAILIGTDFTGAYLRNTSFGDNDLTHVKGLEATRHSSPSYISIDTIYRSGGNIPEKFLRGCGVPEPFIVQIPALVAALSPIQFYSCFISYSSKDQPFAERLYADLQSKGVRCWFAPEDLKIGDRFRDRIDESIRLHDKLLIVLSQHSVASQWVSDEVESAIEREHQEGRIVLFPISIDGAVVESKQAWAATIRRTRHIGDFTRWKDPDSYQKAFERLLRDLKAEKNLA